MKTNVLIFGHGYATQFIDVNNQYTSLFDPQKYHVTVAYLTGNPDEIVRKRHITDDVIFIDSPPRSTRGLKTYAIKKMLALQRKKKFQLVICHRYKPTYVMFWVAKFCKIPAMFSVMHEFKTHQSIARKLSVLALAPKHLIYAGVSNAVRDDLRRDLWGIPTERIMTLYNMIDVEATETELLNRDDARRKLHLAESDFIFGTIGRLAPAKDQQTLINAFAAIKPHCPNAKLIIIGTGQLENDLKTQIQQLHLSNDVILTGYVDKAFKYISAFDVFTLPSIKEAFGRVLLEAMLAKVPIIASKINGIPEVIDHAGILFPATNSAILAKEMQLLYQEPHHQLLQRGEQGYQRAIQHFSLQRFNEIFWQLPNVKDKVYA